MSEISEELRDSLAELIEAREELQTIERWLEEMHPDEMQRVVELNKEIPALLDKVKDDVRNHGEGFTYLGYTFKVTGRKKTVVDTEGLLDRAEERGELGTLMERGLLTYSVVPHQLDRLPGTLKAVYTSYIEVMPQTSAVTVPSTLKK